MKRLLAAALAALLIVGVTASAASSASEYKPVVIANGWSASDVGTAAPLAASLGGSVLYANRDSLGAPTVDALKKLKPSEIVLVGGTKALSGDIVTELGQVVPGVEVTRLAGTDRIHTAALGALYTLGTATPQVTITGAQKTARTGPGNAQEYQNGYHEKRFKVGTDLLPGIWKQPASGAYCGHRDAEGNWTWGRVQVNDGTTNLINFGLVEGDIVTLQGEPGRTCRIEWVRD